MKKNGFTLIELMIAIVIMVILAGIAVPNASAYLARARLASAVADASQLAAARLIEYDGAARMFAPRSDINADLLRRAGY